MHVASIYARSRASRRACAWILALLLVSSPLEAQSPPRTTYAAPNPMFLVGRDEPLACSPVPPQDWHREQGIARQFIFQLPSTRRSGQVGAAANGTARYLLVSLESPGTRGIERYAASLRFAGNGRMEVGRQSWEYTDAQTNQTQSNTSGLREDEGIAALGFARDLLARCGR